MIKVGHIDPVVRFMGMGPVDRYPMHFQWPGGHATDLDSFDAL